MVSTRETDAAHFKPVEITPLMKRVIQLEDALEAIDPCCTCPDGRALGPIEAHETSCQMMIKHRALAGEVSRD